MDEVEALSRDLNHLGIPDNGVSKRLVEMGWTKRPKQADFTVQIQQPNIMKGALPLYQPSMSLPRNFVAL